ncbi:MAG: hypothetical protein LBC64_00995 [Fibromonadaceae bacterium]|nr:hypothetical protein [Fibromonadaceae bacterium]
MNKILLTEPLFLINDANEQGISAIKNAAIKTARLTTTGKISLSDSLNGCKATSRV